MMNLKSLLLLALLVTSFCSIVEAQKFPGRRFALVIGNSNYENGALKNPGNDADAIAKSLADLEFDVTKLVDQNRRQILKAVNSFTENLEEGDLCLLFYAGHGAQINGANYVVPIGADIGDEADVEFECVALDRIMKKLESSDCSFKVLVLDCCRDNPFSRSFSRTMKRGLSAVAAQPDGTIIAFSTKPGEVASDGNGDNSPYTECLIEVLKSRRKSGLELIDVFRSTAQNVAEKNGQRPFIRFDAAMQKVFLLPAENSNDRADDVKEPAKQMPAHESVARSLSLEFVEIPAGNFMMGGDEPLETVYKNFPDEDFEGNPHPSSYPQHKVTITKPFHVSAHEITIGQFRAFVKETGYQTDVERGVKSENSLPIAGIENMRWDSSRHFNVTDKYPVTMVSWTDCQAFCKWLSGKLGKKVSLPTQAQWEYACRAGSTKRFSFGNSLKKITHFANVPSRIKVNRVLINDGERELFMDLGGVATWSLQFGQTQPLEVFADSASGSLQEIKEVTVLNKSEIPLKIENQLIQRGGQVKVEPEEVDECYGAIVYFRKSANSRWQAVRAYQGGCIFFYQGVNQDWIGYQNSLSVPQLVNTNQVEVQNIAASETIQLKTAGGIITLNPGERRAAKAFLSRYWSDSEDGYPNRLAPVGQFMPNEFGLYDMHGNVWEWCQDGFDLDYSKRVQFDPVGSKFTDNYAIRGGCYL